jgi:excisionase family DNA binding protein
MEATVEVCRVERCWFDIDAAAEYLMVRPRTIREAVWSGELERAHLGKKFIFCRDALDRWARSKTRRE